MVDDTIRFSVIVPVYGNEGSVDELVERLESLNTSLGGELEAVLVVDGSPDRSGELLRKRLAEAPFRSRLLWHSRNFGSFAAIRTGLGAAGGQYVAVMAADLQEPAEVVLESFELLGDGDCDIVVGVRAAREGDPALSRAMSAAYWGAYRRLVMRDLPPGGIDIFACTRQVMEVLLTYGESHSSLVGLLYWSGFRRAEVRYERAERADGGRSGWTMKKKIRYMMDSIYSFTDVPVTIMKAFGVMGTVFSVVLGAMVLLGWAMGLITVPGYTPLMLVLLFTTSSIMLSLGVVGSYVWRTYENSKQRPFALVMWNEAFNGNE